MIETKFDGKESNQLPKYPYIGINESNNTIVLFLSTSVGICLHASGCSDSTWEYSRNWAEYNFKKYDKEFTIKNV